MKNKGGILGKLRRGDYLIILVVLALAAGIFLYFASVGTGGEYGEIWQDGKRIDKIKLADGFEKTVTIKGEKVTNVVEISGKRMRFQHSDCFDQTCVHTGWISSVGQVAVCLPNRVILKITGTEQDNNVDIIVK